MSKSSGQVYRDVEAQKCHNENNRLAQQFSRELRPIIRWFMTAVDDPGAIAPVVLAYMAGEIVRAFHADPEARELAYKSLLDEMLDEDSKLINKQNLVNDSGIVVASTIQ